MLTLRPELSNLDACEMRETPLTWLSTTGALAHLSLFIIVRRAQGHVTAATGACDRSLQQRMLRGYTCDGPQETTATSGTCWLRLQGRHTCGINTTLEEQQ